MKKTLSLILAALLCAATTTVVAAEEVTETVAEDTAVVEETIVEEAAAEDAVVLAAPVTAEDVVAEDAVVAEVQVVPYNAEELVAVFAELEIAVTPGFIVAAFEGGLELNVENILALALEYELTLTEEQAALVIDVLGAFMIMPLTEEIEVVEEVAIDLEAALADPVIYEIVFSLDPDAVMAADTEVLLSLVETALFMINTPVVEEPVVEVVEVVEEIVEEAVIEEEVVEEKGLLEKVPTFGLLSKFPMYRYLTRG